MKYAASDISTRDLAKIPNDLEMEESKSRRCAESSDKDRKEARRARMVKMRKALRDWKIEKSRIKGINNARRDRKKMEAERGLIAWLKNTHPKRYKRKNRTFKRLQEAKVWFDHLDFDHSGEISEEELLIPLISMGFAHSKEEVRELIAHVDTDGSGEIGFDEFWMILNEKDTDNAFKKLHRALDSGELGNHNLIGVQTLLSTYRRKVLYAALMSYGWQDPKSKVFSSRDKAKFKRSINALDKVFISKESQQTQKEDTECVPKGKKFGVSADPRKISRKARWHRKINSMDKKDVRRTLRHEQKELSADLKNKERQLFTLPRTKLNCPGQNLYSLNSYRTNLDLPPPPGAKEMLEVTRKKLRAEIEQKRLADKPPPGVNPVLAKLLKTQAVKSKSYAPKHPEIYSVAVDKKKTLSAGAQIATSRYAVQSQLDPVLTGKIRYITDKYVDVERFRGRYVHKIK